MKPDREWWWEGGGGGGSRQVLLFPHQENWLLTQRERERERAKHLG